MVDVGGRHDGRPDGNRAIRVDLVEQQIAGSEDGSLTKPPFVPHWMSRREHGKCVPGSDDGLGQIYCREWIVLLNVSEDVGEIPSRPVGPVDGSHRLCGRAALVGALDDLSRSLTK